MIQNNWMIVEMNLKLFFQPKKKFYRIKMKIKFQRKPVKICVCMCTCGNLLCSRQYRQSMKKQWKTFVYNNQHVWEQTFFFIMLTGVHGKK